MGLAYNLDTTVNPYMGLGLSNYFVQFPQYQVASQASEFGPGFLEGISFFDQEQSPAERSNGWNWRWCGKKGTAKQTCQGIFPTGEFIIRDITFVNGHYAIVGAYKATFLDLYGTGTHGEAWDGFLMIYRGYSDNTFIPFGEDGIPASSDSSPVRNPFAATGIGILPMRMPYDILPSSTPSVTEDMSDVGLYCVDVWRGGLSETLAPQPGGGDPVEAWNICLWLGGTQGVGDPVAQGMTYTNIDRIAFGMVGIFGCISYPDPLDNGDLISTISNYYNAKVDEQMQNGPSYAIVGGNASILQYNTRANQTMKIAWDVSANDTMYDGVGIGPENKSTDIWRGCKIENSLSLYVTDRPSGGAYIYNDYEMGWLPNGLNICTGDTRPDDTTADEWNYYPKCFYDVQGYSSQTVKISGVSYPVTTPAQFCGDAWVGTDDPTAPSPNAKKYPMVMGAAWNPTDITTKPFKWPTSAPCGSIRQPPYLQMGVAYPSFKAAAGGTTQNSIFVSNKTQAVVKTTDGTFQQNWGGLQNSYFAFATLPYEEMGADYDTGGRNPSERPPLRYFYLNNAPSQDNTTLAGIFVSEADPFQDGYDVEGIAFTGMVADFATNTPLPIQMPNKWTAKFQQTRTFTTQEEESAKSLKGIPSIEERRISDFKVWNSRNGEAVGVRNNYPRLGIEPFNPNAPYDPTLNTIAQQGSLSNEAQGGMGWKLVSDVENPTGAVLTTSFNTDCTPIKGITIGFSNNFSPPPPAPTYFLAGDPSYPVGGYMMTLNYLPPCSNWSFGKFEPTVVDVPGSTVPIQAGNILDGGDGWKVGQEGIFITGTSSTGAGVINANMQEFTVNAIYDGGVGYTIGGKSTTPLTGSGSGLTINVTAVSAVGEITAYSIINAGSGYRIGERVEIVDAGATTVAILKIDTIDRTTLGIEPVVCILDSGGGWLKNPSFPVTDPNYSVKPNYSNSLQNRGATFNSKILTDPNSTSRIALGCRWDNDRDQWIFLFGNYTAIVANQGVNVVSTTSTFTDNARFGSAYLDQSENFKNVAPYNNAIWQSFPMTNNLDGMVIFGATTDDGSVSSAGVLDYSVTPDQPQSIYGIVQSSSTRPLPTQRVGCAVGTDPSTISYNVSKIKVFNLDGSTGRQAFVWVDYILFDGADAVIATKLRERGMKVTIDTVEWFKRKIINRGDLNIKQEEIEDWMRQQQDEFTMMMRDAERMGRVRKKKKQVSAYSLDMLESINTDFEDKEVQEFMQDYLPKSRPPTPEEEMLERQRKGGYSPQSKSYYDEVFEQ